MLWQPSLDTQIKIADINTYTYVNKTVQEILDWMSANDLGDSFAIRSSGYEYGCSIFPFTKVASVKTAYFADNNYIQYSTSSSGFIGTYGFNGRELIGSIGRFGRYALQNGIWTSLGSFEFMTKTINSVEYAFIILWSGTEYNNCNQYYGFYINDIDNFYFNNVPYQNEYRGGAGSGYIGNSSLVSYTAQKKMVGYDVPTSSSATTKTESIEAYDINPEANTPKSGNGHVRIKFLKSEIIPSYLSEVGTYNFDSDENKHNFKTCIKYQNGSYLGSNWGWDFSMYSEEGMMVTANSLETCLYEDGATVSIDTSNGINITYTGFTIKPQAYFWGTGRSHVGLKWEHGGAPEGAYFCGGSSTTYYPTRNDFESLDEVFEWIYKSFRHCNVVLNGTTIVSEES